MAVRCSGAWSDCRRGGPPLNIVIIGNGIAGVTAALELRKRKRDWRITLVSGESDAFYSRTALMYIYMGHMRLVDTQPYEERHWSEQRIERVRGWVAGIDTAAHRVNFDDGSSLAYDKLVLATGSVSNKFGWPGQDLERVQGLYSLQDLELLERNTPGLKRGVIVGGGLIGIELAEMLHSRGIAVTMLARESEYWNNAMPKDESRLIARVIREAHIDLRLQTELAQIVDDGHGRACAVMTGEGERIDCQLVGLTAGVRPNLSALKDSGIATRRGILVNLRLEAQVEDVYACGDCAELQSADGSATRVEQLWYTGKMQGEVCAENLAGGRRDYERGIWFNSAKFIDLEWHTYGRVSGGSAPVDPAERHGFWAAENGRHALRIVERDGAVIGMNALGLRHRHRVWERFISEGRSAREVLDRLSEAHFDPEFYRRHESTIRGSLMEQFR